MQKLSRRVDVVYVTDRSTVHDRISVHPGGLTVAHDSPAEALARLQQLVRPVELRLGLSVADKLLATWTPHRHIALRVKSLHVLVGSLPDKLAAPLLNLLADMCVKLEWVMFEANMMRTPDELQFAPAMAALAVRANRVVFDFRPPLLFFELLRAANGSRVREIELPSLPPGAVEQVLSIGALEALAIEPTRFSGCDASELVRCLTGGHATLRRLGLAEPTPLAPLVELLARCPLLAHVEIVVRDDDRADLVALAQLRTLESLSLRTVASRKPLDGPGSLDEPFGDASVQVLMGGAFFPVVHDTRKVNDPLWWRSRWPEEGRGTAWQVSDELIAMIRAFDTTLRVLRIGLPEHDVDLFNGWQKLRVAHVLRGRNRALCVDWAHNGGALLHGMLSWRRDVRARLLPVALALAPELPVLVVLAVFGELDVPELEIRNFDAVIWDAVKVVRDAAMKKTS